MEALHRYVLAACKLHADDTPVSVLAPGQGKTKTGRLSTYVREDRTAGDTDAPAVWFAYSPDRKGEHPAQHLKKFRGTLQADAYAGFNQLYDDRRIQQACCWAHVRRHFYDLEQAHSSPIAPEALARIGALYAVEEPIRGRPPDERRTVRHAQAKPLVEFMRQCRYPAVKSGGPEDLVFQCLTDGTKPAAKRLGLEHVNCPRVRSGRRLPWSSRYMSDASGPAPISDRPRPEHPKWQRTFSGISRLKP